MKNNNPYGVNFNSTLVFLAAFLFLSSCKLFSPEPSVTTHVTTLLVKDSMIVVMKRPGVDDETFRNYINEHKGDASIYYCRECDSSIVMVPRAMLTALGASGLTASGGILPGDRPSGAGFGIAYWCTNFQINLNTPYSQDSMEQVEKVAPVPFSEKDSVIVAVLDSGVDTALLKNSHLLATSINESCLGMRANNGWNFANNDNLTEDKVNPPYGHGSNAAQLIVEQANKIKKTPVKILPVKFLDAEGHGYLFDALCGMAYSVDRGAKIINASFGFYVCDPGDSASLLFKEFIRHSLTNNDIILVTAAGNVEMDVHCGDRRNLDSIRFYPASFAGDPEMSNVIAVTTVGQSPRTVSRFQNFSANVVDIGVDADRIEGGHFKFLNPRLSNGAAKNYIEGSSYAAPIVSGIIAGFYGAITREGLVKQKAQILNYLSLPARNMAFKDPALADSIRGGFYTKHF